MMTQRRLERLTMTTRNPKYHCRSTFATNMLRFFAVASMMLTRQVVTAASSVMVANFISEEDLAQCKENLTKADADKDGGVDSNEYMTFVNLASDGVLDPTTFAGIPLRLILTYHWTSCQCVFFEDGTDDCCVGNNAEILVDAPDAQYLVGFCSDVENSLEEILTPAPSFAPSIPPQVSKSPSSTPSVSPTGETTDSPTASPSTDPAITHPPSASPSKYIAPSHSPSGGPTDSPTAEPTDEPSKGPTLHPSVSPTQLPSSSPSTESPTLTPTLSPTTKAPTFAPVPIITPNPTPDPTAVPETQLPSISPSDLPSSSPSAFPSPAPSMKSMSPTTESTIAISFQYALSNQANLSAEEIYFELNNTLKTGLIIATETIVVQILNETFPKADGGSISAFRAAATKEDEDETLIWVEELKETTPNPPGTWTDGDNRRRRLDSIVKNAVEHATVEALGGSNDPITTSLVRSAMLSQAMGEAIQQRSLVRFSARSMVQFGDDEATSRRLVFFTPTIPAIITRITDAMFCPGQSSSSECSRCAIVASTVFLVLEEGDDENEVRTVVTSGLAESFQDGSFQNAIPDENKPEAC